MMQANFARTRLQAAAMAFVTVLAAGCSTESPVVRTESGAAVTTGGRPG